MRLHLEKSHQIVAGEQRITRVRSQSEGNVAEWMAEIGDWRVRILTELEVGLVAGHDPKNPAVGSVDSPVPSAQKTSHPAWSATALRDLYRGMEGHYSPF